MHSMIELPINYYCYSFNRITNCMNHMLTILKIEYMTTMSTATDDINTC